MRNLLVLLAFGLLSTTVAFAQNTKKVTGKVTDENGKVLSGVTVSVGAVKTTSDDNGNYYKVSTVYKVIKDENNEKLVLLLGFKD